MKAKPVKLVPGSGYIECPIAECTHVKIHFPGPSSIIVLPVILKGKRNGTQCWSWNGDTERPTLRPSVETQGNDYEGDPEDPANWTEYRCHSWVTDGKAQFLNDSTHELRGKTVDLIDL